MKSRIWKKRKDSIFQHYWVRLNKFVKRKFPRQDFDLDGVKNKDDCVPLNPFRQEIKSPFITLFHGTSEERAKQIEEEGLKKDVDSEESGFLHLTGSKSAALMHAQVGPETEFREKSHVEGKHGFIHRAFEEGLEKGSGEKGVIFKVKVPKEDVIKNLVREPSKASLEDPELKDYAKASYEDELRRLSTKDVEKEYDFKIKHDIPPENIKRVDTKEFYHKALREAENPEKVGKFYTPKVQKLKLESDEYGSEMPKGIPIP